jgi:uncharacterized protein YkwD
MMRLPAGSDLRQRKPWYKRYWLIRGKRREDKIARMVVVGVALAILPFVFILAAPASPTQTYLPLIAHHSATTTQDDVLALVNAERAGAGCGPLVRQPQLDQAAQDWSMHMANDDAFVHRSLDQLASVYGYAFNYVGENIAAGYTTPQAVMNGWMHSPGHRANILNCRFRDIGIGVVSLAPDAAPLQYGWYWTQNFGEPIALGANSAASAEESERTGTSPGMDTPPGLVAPAYPPPE